jgi:YidC/Oxa1 family membrane protein insertase
VGQIGYFFNLIFSFPILNVLLLLDHIFGDFGLSIIVLTLIVRLCLFPLTLKQLRSTKATQAIQPLLADIRKKYPDQREQYAEMQRLYKEYNINPAAGCLPLLVQMPVIYGLYAAMRLVLTPTGGHLNLNDLNALIYPFLPKFAALPSFYLNWFTFINSHWYISLAQPDPTHILPVLAGLATFAQLRMSQARAAQQRAGSSNKQTDMMTQQMQIMSFVMPFVTFFIALNFPSGLALYWTTTSIFSMVQQYFVTGWGSLFTMPSILGGGQAGKADTAIESGARTSEVRRERSSAARVVDSDAEVISDAAPRTTNSYPGTNGSSTRRRRPNSASARRRGNVPKRNVSRS